MKFSLRALLIMVGIAGMLFALAVPLVRYLQYDPVTVAVQELQDDGASVSKLIHNGQWLGDYAYVGFAGIEKNQIDTAALRVIGPDIIDLSGTNWNDNDLPLLYGITTNQIILSGTDVTQTGVEKLRANLRPGVNILADVDSAPSAR